MTGLTLVAILILFSLLYSAQLFVSKSLTLKLAIITILFLISSGIYFSFDTYKGWPSKERIGKGYLVYSFSVEPSPDDKGGIFFWAVPEEKDMSFIERFLTYTFDGVAPRAFYLPYSKKAASQFADANEQIRKGFQVQIDGDETTSQQDDQGQGQNKGDGNGNATGDGEQKDYNVPHLEIISPEQYLRKAPQ